MLPVSGIAMHTCIQRRQRLMQLAGPDAVVIVPAAPERVRSRDTLYPYRQDSDLWYLSRFPEPEAVLVLVPGRSQGEVLLFCRARDQARETWDGPRIGPECAPGLYGVDTAWPIGELPAVLPALLAGREQVYCTRDDHLVLDAVLADWAQAGPISGVLDPAPFLHQMRLIKDAEELHLMRHAARISVNAHAAAMRAAHPGLYEYQLQAELEYIFHQHHAVPAYESIVGAGGNGCILHYRANDALICNGDLVLIDAGAEYQGYAADITRTFPANGRFSTEQRVLYDLVLAAHAAALDKARPGLAYEAMHLAAVEVLSEGLLRLGLIADATDYRRFYPHKSGHWLGLDVHDVGTYDADIGSRQLQPGMVLTIEPGLYVPPGAEGVDPKWHGIGIRIEDDVLITDNGHEILTAGLARSADEVEAEMARTSA